MEACSGLANGMRTELFEDTLYSLKDGQRVKTSHFVPIVVAVGHVCL